MTRARILRRPGVRGLNTNLMPSCDGRPLPAVPRTEPQLAAKCQFLDAYYHINVHCSKLRDLRRNQRQPDRKEERALLQAIERALLAKEALEDRWASRGLVATPEQESGITVNIRFSHAGSPAARPTIAGSSATITMTFVQPGRPRRNR